MKAKYPAPVPGQVVFVVGQNYRNGTTMEVERIGKTWAHLKGPRPRRMSIESWMVESAGHSIGQAYPSEHVYLEIRNRAALWDSLRGVLSASHTPPDGIHTETLESALLVLGVPHQNAPSRPALRPVGTIRRYNVGGSGEHATVEGQWQTLPDGMALYAHGPVVELEIAYVTAVCVMREMVAAMRSYEAGTDEYPPFHHRDLMTRADAICRSATPMMKIDHKTIAAQWRRDNGYEHKGGLVVIWRGVQVSGWVNELRDPQHWEPGCIAVDSDGNCWVAVGGDGFHGAKQWEKVEQ